MANKSYKNRQEEFDSAVSYGASFDHLNLARVSFWLIFGTLVLVITIYGVYNMYAYNQFLSSHSAAINAEFHDQKMREERVNRNLNALELINEEEARYRIPIDSAMSIIINDSR